MDIEGKNVCILGGYGLVGRAISRKILAFKPRTLVVASLYKKEAEEGVAYLKKAYPHEETQILPAWGDVFLRASWQKDGVISRRDILKDPQKRHQLVEDILFSLTEEMVEDSQLAHIVLGKAPGLQGRKADILIDCMNTATAVAYQNVYATAQRLMKEIKEKSTEVDWIEEVETLLATQYIPQLVRHMQILQEAMIRAGTRAYLKVGTSGTGGMGLNIPYTHGEEKPSRVLMSKSCVAGAQTLLIFLLARTPQGPAIVKEIKPSAAIAWKEINYGPITRHHQTIPLVDCPFDQAVPLKDPDALKPEGSFGTPTGKVLEAVYIHTGENGLFSVGEFTTLTALGQMEFITPEEIADVAIRELLGGNTGKDVVAALDASILGPSYRAGYLREAALHHLRALEEKHGASIAFEILGPPRLSKLLFEAYLLKRSFETFDRVSQAPPEELSERLEKDLATNPPLRQQILSIGIPILLADGQRLLRGPMIKADKAEQGWVDLTPSNMEKWQKRMTAIFEFIQEGSQAESSSWRDRPFPGLYKAKKEDTTIAIGETVSWIFQMEEKGYRIKR